MNRSQKGQVPMLVSVHIADISPRDLLNAQRAPRPASTPGLRSANVASCAQLGGSVLPVPKLTRAGLVAFWDDDASLDAFLETSALARILEPGFRVRLAPLRAHGTWPGLDADIAQSRTVEHDGAAAVVTIARTKWTRLPAFLGTSNKAEKAVVVAPGLIWATGMGKPPFFATFSLWESTRSLSTYAYGNRDRGHPDAMAANDAKPFHHESAFIRFRPYDAHGRLDGKHPLRFPVVAGG
jgi:hypothetical protein